ncbi:hypothetical protein [Jiulongibacter sediminis]|uniref:Uncharacterized protein n=1 Tax=Jiulongibacter sediminis TaxID=1605367 RepID=A0A0P7BSB6_9BACT|nr:hypothetical protein [Jiulongibacter sediminis]KPM47841.1 hypothetical protein AFM12_11375 [Jiulongibacter sediminis]TBX24026.1 hypothetical protein TK44_11380 [Jiulongibacter sediminis]
MITELIKRIQNLQSEGDQYFDQGLFPSFRVNPFWNYRRPDNNIFSSLSVCFVLNGVESFMQSDERLMIKEIKEKLIRCLPKYQTKPDRQTFNFYQSGEHSHFPNGFLMHRFRHFKLPDDIDDTALSFLIQKAEISYFKNLLIEHAHEDGVYDTWFGKNMPKEKDACALSNLMYLVFGSGEELNINDRQTLEYLNEVIVSEEYLKNPFWVSRHYGTVPLIVYHYARLIEKFDPPQLAEASGLLKKSLPELLKNEKVFLNQLLLQTAGYRLGLDLKLPESNVTGQFYSFIGAPFAPLPSLWLKNIASQKWALLYWKCEAHELALQLENAVCKRIIAEEI